MTEQQPEAHIKEPYTLAEIKAKIASNDYSAEMLLQHAMRLLDGAALSANVEEPTQEFEKWLATYSTLSAAVAGTEHDLKDVRCECCGYMTYHREHMGCIRAAYAARAARKEGKS